MGTRKLKLDDHIHNHISKFGQLPMDLYIVGHFDLTMYHTTLQTSASLNKPNMLITWQKTKLFCVYIHIMH